MAFPLSIQATARARLPRHALPGKLALWLALTLSAVLPQSIDASESIPSAPPGVIETGIPAFNIYSNESLGLQSAPYDLVEMPDGRILVASSSELVFGDGVRWDLIQRAPSETAGIPGRIALDEKGDIYVSLATGFARLGFDSTGHWHVESIQRLPDHHARNWPAFLINSTTNSHTYWFGNALVQWDPGSVNEPRILMPRANVSEVFSIGSSIYAASSNDGSLLTITPSGAVLNTIPPESTTGNYSITCSTPLDSQRVLVGTVTRGVQVFDGKTLTPFVSSGPLSGGNIVNSLCATRGGFFAAAINGVGIIFFDTSGRVIQTIDRRIDYRFANIRRLIRGSDGTLWALFPKGVARIDFPSRISYLDPYISAATDYVDAIRHEERLWLLATGTILRGVYDDSRRLVDFEKDSPAVEFVFSVASVEGRLIAATDRGLYQKYNDSWSLLVPGIVNARICAKSPVLGRWLYAARDEIGWLDFSGEQVTVTKLPRPGLGDIFNAVLDRNGMVWLELGAAKAARVNLNREQADTRIFTSADGIAGGWAELFVIDNRIRLNCSGRTYLFDEPRQRFEPDTELVQNYPELKTVIGGRPARDAFGRLWILGTDYLRIITDANGTQPRSVESLPGDIKPNNFITAPDGTVWLQERLRFAHYDPRMPKGIEKRPRTIITRFELPGSNRIIVSPGQTLAPLEHTDNSFIAHFLAVNLPFGEYATFEMLVEGLGDQWTPLGVSGNASINRIKEGNYTLRIRPKTASGVGDEAILSFTILPPWYRSHSAYVIMGLTGLALISAAILVPVFYERRQKYRLERLVAYRTQELSNSQDRYRTLNIELEKRVADRTAELAARVADVEHLNRDLDQAATKLTEANKELESFSYSVSHDLRAPLRNITGFIEIMTKKLHSGDPKSCDHYMEVITSEARRMGCLIEDLLAFSRISRIEMKRHRVDMNGLVQESLNALTPECANRHIEWRVGNLPSVLGDKALLGQVLANLLGNAIKFTSKRPNAVIEIGCLPTPDETGMLVFFIRDNGAGFNPKYMDKLFGVFQRLHSTREFEGTGIGLANVKRIITRHNGRVWAEGMIDAGATFYFTLKQNATET